LVALGVIGGTIVSPIRVSAGDILRGGAAYQENGRRSAEANAAISAAAAEARRNSQDALKRTSQALDSVRNMQAAARAAAAARQGNNLGENPNFPGTPLPDVPNGLAPGGLQVDPGVGLGTAQWTGANLPTQTQSGGRTNVNIRQTQQQALLSWRTFNVGKETTLNFDQSAGGVDAGKWIAFNRVTDPTGNPSQILGSIQGQGQVYIINPNGILFGGTSQINLHTLVASSLPINDNLVQSGLLNNRDAQFLFSGLSVPGGSDGTPPFTPPAPPVALGRFGDIRVLPGAKLTAPAGEGGSGGRIMLVGANVNNEGHISAESGQTILAAGLQIGIAAHDSADPSLRGLDVWVGDVGNYGGTVTNRGLIEVPTGSALMTGRRVEQLGAIGSTTTVNLNGRIDLIASYGAVGNPNYDNASAVGGGGPPFLYQHTGLVTTGAGSVMAILPDYASAKAVPGTALPERSRVNMEGSVVHLGDRSTIFAPNGLVNARAGTWPYTDADGNRTIFNANGDVEPGIPNQLSGGKQRFFLSSGQIHVGREAMVNVSGSTDVFVPLAHSILDIELRGSELADAVLQRGSILRGIPLTVDIRRTGVFNGRFWVGTPLGDATGLAGLIERNAAQLTARGGDISFSSGGSIVTQPGSVLDVSGGTYVHEAGMVKTTWLTYLGQIIPIEQATPNRIYSSIFTGKRDETHARWGVTKTFSIPLIGQPHYEQSYVAGANGGNLSLKAPSMALDGILRGRTVPGQRQRDSLPDPSSLTIAFEGEKRLDISPADFRFLAYSPFPPDVIFGGRGGSPVPSFDFAGGAASVLPADRVARVLLPAALLDEDGFGKLKVRNPDGTIHVPSGVNLVASPLGEVNFEAANVFVAGSITAPGGNLSFTTYNISPTFAAEFPILNPAGALLPAPVPGRGIFSLGGGGRLSTAGLIVNDRPGSQTMLKDPIVIKGGNISIATFDALLSPGGAIDVSGGLRATREGITYGDGGSISILSGRDVTMTNVTGGRILLGSELSGYSGATGGSLTLQANLIQIGGGARFPGTLLLQPDFFQRGGFTKYTLNGIGMDSDEPAAPGGPDTYVPGLLVAPGTVIEPRAESLLAVGNQWGNYGLEIRRILKPQGLRKPVSLSLGALGADDTFTLDEIEARGDLVLGRGSRITVEPGASVSLSGQTVSVFGSVYAPGGSITVRGASAFPLPPSQAALATAARPTVHLAAGSVLSTAGVVQYVPDAFGRRLGTVYGGGSISVFGNIIAERGALLDVSGTSGILDIHPSWLGIFEDPIVPHNSGLDSPLWSRRAIATRIDSSGGTLDLQGSEMLFSDATLLGKAGGPTATGGTLSIFSGRFYAPGETRTGADINLVVTQNGQTIAATNTNPGVGRVVLDGSGAPMSGMGYFAADSFHRGGFASLDLGAKYLATASPIPYGGNVKFVGPVNINAGGMLRVAAGGVIEADSAVNLRASYIAIGQPFRAPDHPNDTISYFKIDPAVTGSEYTFAPTNGPGSLNLVADLIDIGTLSMRNIGNAHFRSSGDIRGNGIVSMAGNLTLAAAQIYPTTLAKFSVFAHDSAAGPGSITVLGNGRAAPVPYSAGGELSLYATTIRQDGILRAPMGTIRLGWDGTDLDLSTPALDRPVNPIAGSLAPVNPAASVTLGTGSVTSVAAMEGGRSLIIPFGLSPDGLTWIDPRGVDVTLTGLPTRNVIIGGTNVTTESGSLIDVRGGGELLAFRWLPGPGGSVDLLGTASAEWTGGTEYEAGDLVTHNGETWSARLAHSGVRPEVNLYWTKVSDSWAILPGFGRNFAPYAPFNSGPNAAALGGDPGYVSSSLRLGDVIRLGGSPGLSAGTYTLLPRRYALLPGSFLVTPQSGMPVGTFTMPDGSSLVAGSRFNSFQKPDKLPPLVSRFEIAPRDVVLARAEYELFEAGSFMREAAARVNATTVQSLPADAGYLSFGTTGTMNLLGAVNSAPAAGGKGARADINASGNIRIVGGSGTEDPSALNLRADQLASWGIESLLVGGARRTTATGIVVDTRATNLTLDNPGSLFGSPDVILLAKEKLVVTGGSSLAATGRPLAGAEVLTVTGDGALVRASGDPAAAITRSNLGGSTAPLLEIGDAARLAGSGLILDSTYASSLASTAILDADALTLGSGQISLLLPGSSGALAGSLVNPHLVLSGTTLQEVQQVDSLTLRSYRTIDIYGSGTFGRPDLDRLTITGAGLRGYENSGGPVTMVAGDLFLGNQSDVAAVAAPPASAGSLIFETTRTTLGGNNFAIAGYTTTTLGASSAITSTGTGQLGATGDLVFRTPLLTGERGSTRTINAGGNFTLLDPGGAGSATTGIGAALSIQANAVDLRSDILLPSGKLEIQARSGNIQVSGNLNVEGVAQAFNDLTRYADAGSILLAADAGSVNLEAGSRVSVAAQAGGGNAGSLVIRSPGGAFGNNGVLLGDGGTGGRDGSFQLDAATIPGFDTLSASLNAGGFTASRQFRLRTGDITIDGPITARAFTLLADAGSITVDDRIDASGLTGGRIQLGARGNVNLTGNAVLTVRASEFNSAGKGGEIRLEAGNQINGTVNSSAIVDIASGAVLDLGVDSFVAGNYLTPGSSASRGQLAGTLHLRAPRTANDVGISSLLGDIRGASSVVVEAYRLYDITGSGNLTTTLRGTMNTDAQAFINANEAAITTRLLAGAPGAATLGGSLVLAPGVEIINRTGDLNLGTPNAANGNATTLSTGDWDLSAFRYGSKGAPGVLTLRAAGDIVFNNTLSDGFNPVTASADNGHSAMWLATLMTLNPNLPMNTQSWSYGITAGADFSSAGRGTVLAPSALAAGKGSVLVGEFYPAIPNSATTGTAAAIGSNGQTADTIRISTSNTDRGTRFEVIRTGTGGIDVNAGRDVQLRNQFATIYTAGVAVPVPTTIFQANDFVVPVIPTALNRHPSQSGGAGTTLGAIQQLYQPAWTLAGGNLSLRAQADIGRFTLSNGNIIADSSRQMPTNWLYRRGYVDPATGLFASDGGVDSTPIISSITDPSTSTTWWIDFSNFFQGVGSLGGGDVSISAGRDVVNLDAVIPTNARMAGLDPSTGGNLAPSAERLLEWGGGDLSVIAGRDISGGVYYAERGRGELFAGGEITTNAARTLSLGILDTATPAVLEEITWMPTTLFTGKSDFRVAARGDVLLGPALNPYLLPQGLNNRYWYKTFFQTYSGDSGIDVASFGGSVTHRHSMTLPGGSSARSVVGAWFDTHNLFAGVESAFSSSNFQPWLRLNELGLGQYSEVFILGAPNLRSTAFAGDVNLVGDLTLFPSARGQVELLASGSVVGLQPTGTGSVGGRNVQVWTSATLNLSDANPASFPAITSPLGYQSFTGRNRVATLQGNIDALDQIGLSIVETGSFTGASASIQIKQALHAPGLLHAGDPNPLRVSAVDGDITGFTLFSPKASRIHAGRDITDIAFYLQNVAVDDISIVSSGRDVIPFNTNAPVRSDATNLALGNAVGDPAVATADGRGTSAMAGDIQINGPGVLEVLAGRNIDLGTGPNFTDGRGVGITSIGNARNPFLPFAGADILALAGVGGASGGPALGLSGSNLDFDAFIAQYLAGGPEGNSAYMNSIGAASFASLNAEQRAIVALEEFYRILAAAGETASTTGNYDEGYAAIEVLFGGAGGAGDVFTRARDIRTSTGGNITIVAPGGGLTMASDIFGNPLTPPGVVTEYGGGISVFTDGSVDIGQARIFTLRGGDITMWSSTGDIAAGSSPRTVVTAPPTRVLVDVTSANIQTDLGGLATGGGIGVLAAVEGVEAGNVALIAPQGVVDAGDAGIRATGNLTIAATAVLNASNIQVAGGTAGVPSAPAVAAPNIGGLTAASSAAAATTNTATQMAQPKKEEEEEDEKEEVPSIIEVEVLGYGGGEEVVP
jgi:filamentous hemagglutinin family protein